ALHGIDQASALAELVVLQRSSPAEPARAAERARCTAELAQLAASFPIPYVRAQDLRLGALAARDAGDLRSADQRGQEAIRLMRDAQCSTALSEILREASELCQLLGEGERARQLAQESVEAGTTARAPSPTASR
ncbi:MAG: hypothetical protein ACREEC_00460, partial [Thermoplasmata archaeon]